MVVAYDVELADKVFLRLLQATLQVLVHTFLFVNPIRSLEMVSK